MVFLYAWFRHFLIKASSHEIPIIKAKSQDVLSLCTHPQQEPVAPPCAHRKNADQRAKPKKKPRCLFQDEELFSFNLPPYPWSGKGVTLLPLPPLRTVRATFIAYRSSILKALLDGEPRQPIPALTSRYRPGATKRFRLWAHQQV